MAQGMSDLERALLGALGGAAAGYGGYLQDQRQDKRAAERQKRWLAGMALQDMLARQRADEAYARELDMLENRRQYHNEPVPLPITGAPGVSQGAAPITAPRYMAEGLAAKLMANQLGLGPQPKPADPGDDLIPFTLPDGTTLEVLRSDVPQMVSATRDRAGGGQAGGIDTFSPSESANWLDDLLGVRAERIDPFVLEARERYARSLGDPSEEEAIRETLAKMGIDVTREPEPEMFWSQAPSDPRVAQLSPERYAQLRARVRERAAKDPKFGVDAAMSLLEMLLNAQQFDNAAPVPEYLRRDRSPGARIPERTTPKRGGDQKLDPFEQTLRELGVGR